jgi:hypothetical protein
VRQRVAQADANRQRYREWIAHSEKSILQLEDGSRLKIFLEPPEALCADYDREARDGSLRVCIHDLQETMQYSDERSL